MLTCSETQCGQRARQVILRVVDRHLRGRRATGHRLDYVLETDADGAQALGLVDEERGGLAGASHDGLSNKIESAYFMPILPPRERAHPLPTLLFTRRWV